MNVGEANKIIGILNNKTIAGMNEALIMIQEADGPPKGLEDRLVSLRYDVGIVMQKLQSASVDFSQIPPFVQKRITPKRKK